MTWLEALILGLVQGLTEFLPVSSSGHLEIGSVLLNIKPTDNLLFAVVVHAATALSTITVFRSDIGRILGDLMKPKWTESHQFGLKIGVSMIPVGVVGILFQDEIESFFSGNLALVGSMLIVTALLLTFTYYKIPGRKDVGLFSAFLIGLAQMVAILPGISRSGATISIALMLGVEKEKAARFSFLMVLIPILGATALKLKDLFEQSSAVSEQSPIFPLLVGFLGAFLSGFLACKWMIGIVKNGKLIYFGIYCFIVGCIALISHFL